MSSPTKWQITLKINGVDRTSYLAQPGNGLGLPALSVESILTRSIDTCTFGIVNAHELSLADWDTVLIHLLGDSDDKYFYGFISSMEDTQPPGSVNLAVFHTTVFCVDATALLDKSIINKEWLVADDTTIVSEMFSNCEPVLSGEFDASTNVTAVLTGITKFRANRLTVRQALDKLANYTGADWYVDSDMNIHYFAIEESSAPFGISDVPDEVNYLSYSDFKRARSGVERVNLVTIVGGDYLSDPTTFYIAGTGQDNRVSSPFRMHGTVDGAAVSVARNDGSEGTPSWTSLTVLPGYINTNPEPDTVLHYYQEKALAGSANWPNLPNAIKVVGRILIPLRKRVRDDASYTAYGRYFQKIINDPSITDKTEATRRAKIELAKYASVVPSLTCTIRAPGARAGQTIEAVNAAMGINDTYLLQRVTMQQVGGGWAEFRLQLGTYNPDLVDMIYALRRESANPKEWREDEVLDELLEASEDIELTEGARTATVGTPPYTWGVGGANDFNWDFFTWS